MRRVLVVFMVVSSLLALVAASSGPSAAQGTTPVFGGEVVPVDPVRILDTRLGLGRPGTTPVPVNGTFDLQVAGVGGVPPFGASAVFLNVTVTEPSSPGHLTVFPCCGTPPTASNLNFVAGDSVPNLVLTQLGPNGQVRFSLSGASGHVVADVAGWVTSFGSGITAGRVTPVAPFRVLDSRSGAGAWQQGETRTITLPAHVVPPGSTAVVMNLTGTEPTAPTHLTVSPTGAPRPVVSNLNLRAGETRPNLTLVKIGAGNAIDIFNNAGSTHVIGDIVGYVGPSFNGPGSPDGRLLVFAPDRILDTRFDGGGPFGPADWMSFDDVGLESEFGTKIRGFIDNYTITEPTAPTFVSILPGTVPPPAVTTSNLNAVAGQTIPNLVLSQVDFATRQVVYNNAGFTHLIADSVAYVLGADIPGLVLDQGASTTPGWVDALDGEVAGPAATGCCRRGT